LGPYVQRHPYTKIRFLFSSSRYLLCDFFLTLYLHFNFLEAVDPNFQREPYNNISFEFSSSPYLPSDFFPPLYLHFNFS